jgi:predicted nucleic acid-binding Zn ribbon protein
MPEEQPREDQVSDQRNNDPMQNDPIQHDPTGLELAQTVARSLGAQARRRRRSPLPKRVGPQMSGARADDRDPKPLSDAVERLVETKGWTTEINVHTLLARWALLVGATNAAHSQPE